MILRFTLATLTLLAALLAAPLATLAIDVDGDGDHDARVREMPWLRYANVGSNCDVWRYNSPWHAHLYVRPPVVVGLPALGRQRVRWRANFWDVGSREYRHSGNWVYATVSAGQSTFFGGGPDAGNGVMITHRQYWQASQSYDHFADDGDRIRADIDVGWYSRRKQRWITREMDVRWVIATTNRTNGQGYSNSSPQKNATC